jgi:methionyl-tRNA formyltransferase
MIQWAGDANRIRNQIKGMVPWPIAFTWWGGRRLKVYRARIGTHTGAPGEVIALARGIEVACGTGSLIIEELQLEGGRRIGGEEFVRGHRLTPGERLG